MKERFYDLVKWVLIILIAVLAFNFTNRYSIVSIEDPWAYKLDRASGKMWLISGKTQLPVNQVVHKRSSDKDVVTTNELSKKRSGSLESILELLEQSSDKQEDKEQLK
jgi:hypothetical protein